MSTQPSPVCVFRFRKVPDTSILHWKLLGKHNVKLKITPSTRNRQGSMLNLQVKIDHHHQYIERIIMDFVSSVPRLCPTTGLPWLSLSLDHNAVISCGISPIRPDIKTATYSSPIFKASKYACEFGMSFKRAREFLLMPSAFRLSG